MCRVFLNQQFAGMHRGGSTPFFIEIGEYLEEDNRIIIVCDNTRRATQVPMDNTDWFNYGGIYRSIELLEVPEVFIKNFRIGLQPDAPDMDRIFAEITLSDSANGVAGVHIDGLNIIKEIEIKNGYGKIDFEAHPELWIQRTD